MKKILEEVYPFLLYNVFDNWITESFKKVFKKVFLAYNSDLFCTHVREIPSQFTNHNSEWNLYKFREEEVKSTRGGIHETIYNVQINKIKKKERNWGRKARVRSMKEFETIDR